MANNSFFDSTKLRFEELYNTSINFIKGSYDNVGKFFTMSSPAGQLLQVILHLGRNILYYIEDSITELNILTASRPQSIKGLAALTGHNPSRATAARGTIRVSYNGSPLNMYGNTIIIPNYAQLRNKTNGLIYTVIMSTEETRLLINSGININNSSSIDLNVVQGSIQYQQTTGTGDALQSFNFQVKKGQGIDNYFVNVYVNGELWDAKESILDMSFQEKACIIRTGQTGGIDVFFGNGFNGEIPIMGSTIMVEYLLTEGSSGNITTQMQNLSNSWEFLTSGLTLNNENIDLTKILNVFIQKPIIFGTDDEPLYLTRLIAPHTSRSYVLANTTNYIYFLKKFNMFSIIDAIPGVGNTDNVYTETQYTKIKSIYETQLNTLNDIIKRYGDTSDQAKQQKTLLNNTAQSLANAKIAYENSNQNDNTIYLFLVPDINKRLNSTENYYTCNETIFKLNEDEKEAILDLIEESGQRVLTVDNMILDPINPKFVLNFSLILWEGYAYDTIREQIISKTSAYFIKNTRRDRIPLSDIISIVESIDGIDSVNAWFIPDKNNVSIYKGEIYNPTSDITYTTATSKFYGLDSQGDIILERSITGPNNSTIFINDIYPIIRGGFESPDGTYFSDGLEKSLPSTINITIKGYTKKNINSLNNKLMLNK